MVRLQIVGNVTNFRIQLGERGRVVLPAELRKRLNLQAGDLLVAFVDDDDSEVRLVSAREIVRRTSGMYEDLAPGRSLVDELIAERRAEALREEAD